LLKTVVPPSTMKSEFALSPEITPVKTFVPLPEREVKTVPSLDTAPAMTSAPAELLDRTPLPAPMVMALVSVPAAVTSSTPALESVMVVLVLPRLVLPLMRKVPPATVVAPL
jgi:hypothetical protein